MTLVLTAASADAVIVAADAALTTAYRGVTRNHHRVLLGVQKVFHVPTATCLVSSWGTAFLRGTHEAIASGDHPVQLWLNEQATETTAGDAIVFAAQLRDTLNAHFAPVIGWTGFDIAYFDAAGLPQRLRVANGENPGIPYAKFEIAERPVSLRAATSLEMLRPLIAGDFNSQIWVQTLGDALRECLAAEGSWGERTLLTPDVERYLQLLVNTIAACRTTLNVGRTIGGEVATAVLTRDGHANLQFSNSTRVSQRLA